jgi:hypothetical protein
VSIHDFTWTAPVGCDATDVGIDGVGWLDDFGIGSPIGPGTHAAKVTDKARIAISTALRLTANLEIRPEGQCPSDRRQ